MLTLVLAVSLAVFLSFTCSLMEAALYAIPWSNIERLRKSGDKTGQLLFEMRSNIDKPITAILTINTVANTAGATVAGGAFLSVFGDLYMAVFAGVFTLLILIFGEIIPKTLGVVFAPSIARCMAYPLAICIRLLSPVTSLLVGMIGMITPKAPRTPQISEDDICAAAGLSRKAGQIKEYEENCVRNVLMLDQKHVHEIMTPRTVVFSLPATATIEEAYKDSRIWQFSRIPVFGADNEDLVGLVERRTIARLMHDKKNVLLSSVMRPIFFVQESQTLDQVLQHMLKARVHLFAVLDEYGGLSGVVSLEDVLEEMLGHEIVDESDKVPDMRALAKAKFLPIKQSPLIRIIDESACFFVLKLHYAHKTSYFRHFPLSQKTMSSDSAPRPYGMGRYHTKRRQHRSQPVCTDYAQKIDDHVSLYRGPFPLSWWRILASLFRIFAEQRLFSQCLRSPCSQS